MTLTELVTTLGPVAGVAMFMWLNRGPNKADKPDPIAQKLDTLIDAHKGQAAAFADMAKTLAILLDRSDR